MVNRLVNDIGFGWTMRAVAFLLLGIVLIGNFTIKSRIPPTKRPLRFMDFIEPYTEPTFFFLTLGVWFVYLGGFLPFTFIIVQARAQGMSTTLAGYLVSILNASSTFGRIIPAHFGDVYGVFNVMVIFTAFGAIANLALWLPSTTISGNTNALIIVFVVLYGFASGCFFSILMAMVAQISDIRKIGVRTGSMYIIASIGVLIGSPIAGAIEGAGSNGFLGLTIFSGLVLMIGAMLVGYSRVLQVGWGLKAKA
jgi:MFS family permease